MSGPHINPDIPHQIRQQNKDRFDFLLGALPGKIAPTDIDQCIEKNGHFLFIECKHPGEDVKQGQSILFNALRSLSRPGATVGVLIVYGFPWDDIRGYSWWRQPVIQCDVMEIRALVRDWYDWAEAQPRAA